MSTLQPDSSHYMSSESPAHLPSALRAPVPNPSMVHDSPSPSPGLPQEPASSSQNTTHTTTPTTNNGVNSGSGASAPNSSASASATGKTQTVFIHKLYDMLHDQSISHLIWWAPSNDSFCLLPGEDFSKVLSQYFKHTNIASFIRQLNMYGFHKVNDTFQNSDKDSSGATPSNSNSNSSISGGSSTTSSNKWEFRHSTNQFRKGDIESLKLIKRRSSKNVNSHKEVVSLKTLPPTSNPMPLDYPQQGPPHYQYNPYHSEDDSIPPSNQPKSGENLSQSQSQYHQSLQIQHQSLLNSNYPAQIHPGAAPPSNRSSLSSPHPGQYHPIPSSSTPIPDSSMPSHNEKYAREAPPPPHSTGTPSHLQYHPHIQQPVSGTPSHPAPPPLQHSTSFENSTNIKFIDINTQVNSLKEELASSNAKYELIQSELKRNSMDTFQILEMFESFVQLYSNTSSNPETEKPAEEKPRINPDIFNRSENNKTPVTSALGEKEDETNTSPMSMSQPKPKKTNSGNNVRLTGKSIQSIQNEISRIKANLHQKLSQPLVNNSNTPAASGYHLNRPPSGTVATKKPSNSNIQIVPQYYPLNPHYTIYNPHNEAYRQKIGTSSLLPNEEQKPVRVPSTADPLQPQPSRRPSRILYDESGNNGPIQSVTSTGTSGTVYRNRAESKSYSPLTIGGVNAGNTAKPNNLQPAVSLPNQPGRTSPNNISSSSSRSSIFDNSKGPGHVEHIKNQFPFPNMSNSGNNESDSNTPTHQPNFQPPSTHLTHQQSHRFSGSRTNSLPNPLIEHAQSPDNAPTSSGPSNLNGYQYQAQRNSFTSMYEHNRNNSHSTIPHSNPHLPPPIGPYQPGHNLANIYPLSSISKSASTSGGTIPTIDTLTSNSSRPTSPKVDFVSKTQDAADQPSISPLAPSTESKNQLPSVSELDKSISRPLSNQISSPIKPETNKLHSLLQNNESTTELRSPNKNQPDFKKRKL